MDIVFTPRLGEQVVVHKPQHLHSVQMSFSARFLSGEVYEEVKRAGGKLEAWCNLPERGTSADWRAIVFEESESSNAFDATASGNRTFSLLSHKELEDRTGNESHALLSFVVDLQVGEYSEFAVTYRLVYPSGYIKWFGQPNQNAVIVLAQGDARFDLLGHDWRECPSDGSSDFRGWRTQRSGRTGDVLEVCKLNETYRSDWVVWAYAESDNESFRRYRPQKPIGSCTAMLFLPDSRTDHLVLPQPFSISCSPGSSINLTSTGDIYFTGTAESIVTVRDYNLESVTSPSVESQVLAKDLSTMLGPHLKAVQHSISVQGVHLISILARSVPPPSIVMIPLNASGRITSQMLSLNNPLMIGPAVSRITLYSESAGTSLVLSSAEAKEMDVEILLDPAGGQFFVCPTYTIGEEGKQCDVCVVSPHLLLSKEEEKRNGASDSSFLKSELNPLGVEKLEDSMEELQLQANNILTSTQKGDNLDTALLADRAHYAQLVVWMTALIQSFFVVMFESALRSRMNNLEMNGHQIEPAPVAKRKDKEDDQRESFDQSVDWIDDSSDSSFMQNGSAIGDSESKSSSNFIAHVPSGQISVLLHPRESSISAHKLKFELQGQAIYPSTIKMMGKDAMLVTFDDNDIGGRLRITLSD